MYRRSKNSRASQYRTYERMPTPLKLSDYQQPSTTINYGTVQYRYYVVLPIQKRNTIMFHDEGPIYVRTYYHCVCKKNCQRIGFRSCFRFVPVRYGTMLTLKKFKKNLKWRKRLQHHQKNSFI